MRTMTFGISYKRFCEKYLYTHNDLVMVKAAKDKKANFDKFTANSTQFNKFRFRGFAGENKSKKGRHKNNPTFESILCVISSKIGFISIRKIKSIRCVENIPEIKNRMCWRQKTVSFICKSKICLKAGQQINKNKIMKTSSIHIEFFLKRSDQASSKTARKDRFFQYSKGNRLLKLSAPLFLVAPLKWPTQGLKSTQF